MTFPVQSGTSTILSVDSNTIQNRIRDVLGISTSGYGISALASRLHSTGTVVRASHYQALYDDLDRAFTHQTGNTMNPAITFSSSTVITTPSVNYLNTISEYIVTNRYTVHPSQTNSDLKVTDTRLNVWNGTISSKVLCTWTSALQADYFFNSGGVIKLDPDHFNNWVSPSDREMARLIDSIGTYTISRNNWVNGVNVVNTFTSPYPYTSTATVRVDYTDKSITFTITLINSDEALLVYPDNLLYTVQDGTITGSTITSNLDILQDVVFQSTSTNNNLIVSPYVVGYDLNQT